MGVYCEVSQGVYWYFSLTLFLFFFFSLLSNPHMLCVDTSNKSSTKKMVWEQNPIIMFFQSLPPKQENNRTMRET